MQMVHSITIGNGKPAFRFCFASWPEGMLIWNKLLVY